MAAEHAHTDWDVVVIGGGPSGSTLGSLLRRYAPEMRILVLERERFPRDHIGESQLPPIGAVLEEMGAWQKIEAAGFPVKIGATYTWGRTVDPWVFGFVPDTEIPDEVDRPGRFEGWRRRVAFQVDRAIYDDILLRHAAELGCTVRQETAVRRVLHEGDRIDGLELADGSVVRGRWYVDASGNAAILRRAMGVTCEVPTLLKNVAFWEYWTNPAWADLPDVKATRVHIRSLKDGWVWNIRLGPDRTSVGYVCNAERYRESGKRPEELYREAIESEPSVRAWLEGATPRGKVEGTTDWSFVVDRTCGANWFLVGECAGFADPILAAGLTLAQTGARELAYTILELDRGEHDAGWLLDRYDELQRRRVRQHMRFAEFWYSANGLFEDIRENCTRIAADAGLRLSADEAFRWLSQGGLGDDVPGQVGVGGLDVAGMRQVMVRFTGRAARWSVDGKNHFELNLRNAEPGVVGVPENGRIRAFPCWRRAGRTLVKTGMQGHVIDALEQSADLETIVAHVRLSACAGLSAREAPLVMQQVAQILEVMATDQWLRCARKGSRPVLRVESPEEGILIRTVAPDDPKLPHRDSAG